MRRAASVSVTKTGSLSNRLPSLPIAVGDRASMSTGSASFLVAMVEVKGRALTDGQVEAI